MRHPWRHESCVWDEWRRSCDELLPWQSGVMNHSGFQVLVLLLDLYPALVQLHIFVPLVKEENKKKKKKGKNVQCYSSWMWSRVCDEAPTPSFSPDCRAPTSSSPAGGAACSWCPAPPWGSPAPAPDTECGSPSVGTGAKPFRQPSFMDFHRMSQSFSQPVLWTHHASRKSKTARRQGAVCHKCGVRKNKGPGWFQSAAQSLD